MRRYGLKIGTFGIRNGTILHNVYPSRAVPGLHAEQDGCTDIREITVALPNMSRLKSVVLSGAQQKKKVGNVTFDAGAVTSEDHAQQWCFSAPSLH